MNDRVSEALDAGLVAARDLPGHVLTAAVASGRLVKVLPGWYSPPEPTVFVRGLALARHDPRAVLLGRAAAALTWWPGLEVPVVRASRRHAARPAPGFAWSRGDPGPGVVMLGELRLTDPAMTVLDLIDELGGTAIDEALRRRAVTLAQLHEALDATPGRPGNDLRRRLLFDSRDEPWSEAERAFHPILRGVALPEPFRTNYKVVHDGQVRYLDAALPGLKLGFEVNGRAFHTTPAAFEDGHERILGLASSGWLVHCFTALMVFDRPDWVRRLVRRLAWARARTAQSQRHRPAA